MTAFSFQPQFVDPIRARTKRQTIRNQRPHLPEPGRELQLYCRQRAPGGFLIGLATCEATAPIVMDLPASEIFLPNVVWRGVARLDNFAHRDGFMSWDELRAFWATHHPGIDRFEGVVIRWGESYRDCDPGYRVSRSKA